MTKTKTTLTDLNELLFEQLERLTNGDLEGDALKREIRRSKAVSELGGKIIENGTLMLNARKHLDEYGISDNGAIPVLGIGRGEC
ncbi:MAG: hypothetical protein IJ410_03435 [Oscillospiraceae bacterium]|nr:hypothetical protein [Oscillospiraceae bacterium]